MRGAVWASDVGVIVDSLLGRRDLRVGAATLLGPPRRPSAERTSFSAAGDIRVLGTVPELELRTGAAVSWTDALSRERFLFGSARWQRLEAKGGLVRTTTFGRANTRLRLGASFRHAAYAVGVAREDGEGALAPTWQFTLSALLK